MKKGFSALFLFILALILLISCPSSPANPFAGITLKISKTVERDSVVNENSEGIFDLSTLRFQYKAYPSEKWSKVLHGTVMNWTDGTLVDEGDGYLTFNIGSMTPSSWVIEIRFLDELSNIVYSGKSEIELQSDKMLKFDLNPVAPVIEKGLGTIVLNVNILEEEGSETLFGNSAVESKLTFRYRRNDKQENNFLNRDIFTLLYAGGVSEDREADVYNADGLRVGSMTYKYDADGDAVGYVITLRNVVYGYYFFYFDFGYGIKTIDGEESEFGKISKLYTWSSTDNGTSGEGAFSVVLTEEYSEKTLNIKEELELETGEGLLSPVKTYFIPLGRNKEMNVSIDSLDPRLELIADYFVTGNEKDIVYEWKYNEVLNHNYVYGYDQCSAQA